MNTKTTLKLALCTALIMAIAMGLFIAPAAADPYAVTVKADKATYSIGSLVTISGTATNAGVAASGVTVGIQVSDPSGGIPYTAIVTTAADGTYSTSFRIPALSLIGTWTATATASVAGTQVAMSTPATFAVTSPTTLTVKPVWAAPGNTVTVTGTNFTASAPVAVSLTWSGLSVPLVNTIANAAGAINASFIVPSIQSQVYVITATDNAGLAATAAFGIGQVDSSGIVAAVNTALANVQSNITATLASVTTAVNSVNSNLGTITSGVSSVQSSLSSLSSTVGSLQGTVNSLNSAISAVGSNVSLVANTLATVYTNLNTVSTTLQGIPAAVNAVGSNVTGVSTSVASLNGVVSSLSGNVATLQSSVSALQSDVATIKTQTADIAGQVNIGSLSTLIIVAIVLALIAAIAAIASIVMMRRKIAG